MSAERRPRLPVLDNFWARTDRSPAGCWEWTGRRSRGYGAVMPDGAKGRCTSAHRYAYELLHGPIPVGLVVRHTCDNPPCIRPDHLILGTQSDNLADMVARGRNHRPVGELNSSARLTEADVRYIRNARITGVSGAALAARFGVPRNTIYGAANRHSWKHVR